MSRVPVWSNAEQKMPASASREPGWTVSLADWNGTPVA